MVDSPRVPVSDRLTYLPPSEQYDNEVYEIYSEEENMKYIPFLYRMEASAWLDRRNSHRNMFENESGAFFDVIENETGHVIGTTGFRVMDKTIHEGEWGVILSEKWQKRGYCREMHDACMIWAVQHGLKKAIANTWETNTRMAELLERYGWKYIETRVDSHGTWRTYELSLV